MNRTQKETVKKLNDWLAVREFIEARNYDHLMYDTRKQDLIDTTYTADYHLNFKGVECVPGECSLAFADAHAQQNRMTVRGIISGEIRILSPIEDLIILKCNDREEHHYKLVGYHMPF